MQPFLSLQARVHSVGGKERNEAFQIVFPLHVLHRFLRQPILCIVGFPSMSIMVCLPRLSDTSTVLFLSYWH